MPISDLPPLFISKAIRFHNQGRFYLVVASGLTVSAVPIKCPGSIGIVFVAGAWATAIWWFSGGRIKKRAEQEDLDASFRTHFEFRYIDRQFHEYPWLAFVPDVLLLTALALHTGGTASPFIPLFVVLGTLGDYALVKWKWRALFFWLFIVLPYTAVVFASTRLGATLLDKFYPPFTPEAYWRAETHYLSIEMAWITTLIYLGATFFASFAFQHLLRLSLQTQAKQKAEV